MRDLIGFLKGFCSSLLILGIGLLFFDSPVTYDRYVGRSCVVVFAIALIWHVWYRASRGYWYCEITEEMRRSSTPPPPAGKRPASWRGRP
jgi:hypothetical protein